MSFSRLFGIVPLACLLAVAAVAQDEKPDLSGNWQLKEPTKTAKSITMIIEQKGKSVHITKTVTGIDGKAVKTEFQCATDGKECEIPGTKISLWFDGQALVEMDAGSEVISKITMKLDGNQLKVDVSHIFPDGAPETYLLAKN
jgi:hypothetical protein